MRECAHYIRYNTRLFCLKAVAADCLRGSEKDRELRLGCLLRVRERRTEIENIYKVLAHTYKYTHIRGVFVVCEGAAQRGAREPRSSSTRQQQYTSTQSSSSSDRRRRGRRGGEVVYSAGGERERAAAAVYTIVVVCLARRGCCRPGAEEEDDDARRLRGQQGGGGRRQQCQ